MPQAPMTAQVILEMFAYLTWPCTTSPAFSLSILVKLWSTSRPHSIFKIDTKANVCSVRFHPVERHYLAYGSAGNLALSPH